MNAQQHQELLEEFILLGGQKKIATMLKHFSLLNFAKLRYEVQKIKPLEKLADKEEDKAGEKQERPRSNKVFNDFIADYPTCLHPIYKQRWELWLKACSLKIQLNEIPENDTERAFDVQWRIYELFVEFDHCQSILKHYREHKRIIDIKEDVDIEGMTALELFKYRNNLRGLICRRKQTIAKLEKELPEPNAKDYRKRLHTLNLRKEQLQQK